MRLEEAAVKWALTFTLAGMLALAGAVCFYYGVRDGSYACGVSGAITFGQAFKTFCSLL